MSNETGRHSDEFRAGTSRAEQTSAEYPNRIAFVVTCKGRLHHLRQSLPLLASQANCECVVVDYDCPDQARLWVAQHFPAVRVVHVANAPRFNLARARNLGAFATSAPWLCFVDADILIDANFSALLAPRLREDRYYRPLPMIPDKWGTYLCSRARFARTGGYDEVIEGWGGEDDDVYRRLEAQGCRLAGFSSDLLGSIPHDDEMRTQHYDIHDKWISQRINILYLQIKYDIARQMGMAALAPEVRQTLYGEVRRSLLRDIARGAEASRFEVTLANNEELPLAPGWGIRRRLVFDLAPRPELQPPPAVPDTAVETVPDKFVETVQDKFVENYFANHAVRKLHLGCGDHLLRGWLDTDLHPRIPGVMQLDASRPLPFADNSFDYVFSEHLIEHMPYPQGCDLLAECRRILKPGGVMRLATPDLAFLLGLYLPDKSGIQQAFLDWSKKRFLPWAPSADDTFVINNAMRDWGHQFIYDDKVLRRALAEAGFGRVVRQSLMKSDIADLRGLENETRSPPGLLAAESMVFEAAKA